MTFNQTVFTGVALAFACAAPILSAQTQADWIAGMSGHDVVLLGEVHDNPAHHLHQAQAMLALVPSAVVFEMLTPEQAEALRDGVPETATESAALLDWDASGWPDYKMYHPVFLAAQDAVIYGAALPRDQVRAAVFGDIATIFGPDAAKFGLDQALDPAQQEAREAMQMSAHCDALPEDMLPGMVAAQRLRDAHFARITLQALAETGGPVAVVTGNGHARTDWGMPVYLAAADPDLSVVSLGQFEDAAAPDAPFDITLVSPAVTRPDPCDAFR